MSKKPELTKLKNSSRPTYDVPLRAITGNTNPRNPLSASLQSQGWDCLKGEKQIWLLGVSDDPEERKKFVGLLEDFDPDIISLAATIRALGLMEPVEVREGGTGTFTLSFGSRRCLATLYNWCILAKPKEPVIQAFLIKANASQMLVRGSVENIRKRQSVIDEAKVMQEQLNIGEKIADIATQFGYSPSTVKSRLALLELSPKDQDKIRTKEMSADAARQEHAKANGKTPRKTSDKPPMRKRKEIEEAANEYAPTTDIRKALDFCLGLRDKIS